MDLSIDMLKLDPEREIGKITSRTREILIKDLRRRGLVVAVSGGIDSSTTLALAVKSIGKEKVLALLMPERHSADETHDLSRLVASHFGVETIYENISKPLEAVGFYERYDRAVRSVVPEYAKDWKSKIVISDLLEKRGFNIFSVVVENPEKQIFKKRLPLKAYLEIVAATNFKQRTRKMMEYYHADRLNYAVAGTPNRLEYDQGFFVKLGDGASDIKPIAHLYKTQVYQLAESLGVPEEIRRRPPTTDTYSLSQGQDEFYFSLPYAQMDICLYAKNHNIPVETVAKFLNLAVERIQSVFDDIETKRSTTRYLHLPGVLIESVSEINI